MKYTYLSSFIFAIFTTSCNKFLGHIIVKKPKVYDINQQLHYWNQQGKYDQNYYYLALQHNEFSNTLFEQVDVTGPLIFNSDGHRITYKGGESCGGVIMESFLNGTLNNFMVDTTKHNFSYYAQRIKDKDGNLITSELVSKKSYTIINSWNRYLGPKYWFRDQIDWIDQIIKDKKLDHIQYIKVNNDFLVENGFKKGSKAKIKRKISKEGILYFELKKTPKSQ